MWYDLNRSICNSANNLYPQQWRSAFEIWGSYNSEDVNCGLLRCDNMESYRWLPRIWRKVLPEVKVNFNTEDGDDTSIWNTGNHLQDYMAS
jgi:hypothetical protein